MSLNRRRGGGGGEAAGAAPGGCGALERAGCEGGARADRLHDEARVRATRATGVFCALMHEMLSLKSAD